jgi:hypothetical protein
MVIADSDCLLLGPTLFAPAAVAGGQEEGLQDSFAYMLWYVLVNFCGLLVILRIVEYAIVFGVLLGIVCSSRESDLGLP